MEHRWGGLLSGGGTTAGEIIKACQSGEVPMEIGCIIASTRNAGGIQRAKDLGVPKQDIIVVNPRKFRGQDGQVDQLAFGLAILKELQQREITVVTQNGWLPLTPEVVIDAYANSIFNQHPGPLPEFGGQGMYGIRVHAARLYFARATRRDYWTEVVAQRVDRDFDRGEVLGVSRIEFYPEELPEIIQARALPFEHRLQVQLLKDFASGNLKPVVARDSIVRLGEEELLEEVKAMAMTNYLHG